MSRKLIEAPGNKSLQQQPTEAEKKADVITDYLEQFGAVDGRVVTSQVMQIYVNALHDLDIRQIEKGLKKYLQQGTRWPWPGTLREFCEEEI